MVELFLAYDDAEARRFTTILVEFIVRGLLLKVVTVQHLPHGYPFRWLELDHLFDEG